MIRQTYGPMMGGLDCENLRDFSQYYRGRYFGMRPEIPRFNGELLPCAFYQVLDKNNVAIFTILGPNQDPVAQQVSFDAIRRSGVFGHPFVAAVPWEISYVYVTQSAFRESIKGIGLERLNYHIPDYGSKSVNAYFSKHPLPNRDGIYATKEALTFVYHLLNRQQSGWREALHDLESGRKIGANISPTLGIHFIEGESDIFISHKTSQIGTVNSDTGNIHLSRGWRFLEQLVRTNVPEDVEIY